MRRNLGEKRCVVETFLHFECNLAGEQVNVANPRVAEKEEPLSVNLQMKPFSIMHPPFVMCSQMTAFQQRANTDGAQSFPHLSII